MDKRHAYSPYTAAAQAALKEADRAEVYGAGRPGFAMHHLPGDTRAMAARSGIKKTTEIDVSAQDSQRSSELEDAERGLRNIDFM